MKNAFYFGLSGPHDFTDTLFASGLWTLIVASVAAITCQAILFVNPEQRLQPAQPIQPPACVKQVPAKNRACVPVRRIYT